MPVCFEEFLLSKSKKGRATMLQATLFDLYKAAEKELKVHICGSSLFSVVPGAQQSFFSAAEPLWGCFIGLLHSG